MLQLDTTLLQRIEEHGTAAYPYEGCGLLLGESVEGRNVIHDIFPAENQWPVQEEKRTRFRIAPEEMLRAEMAAMERGLEVVGIFHSHPDVPPVASPRDLTWATWPGYSYLITGINNAQPAGSRSWQLRPDRQGFVEEEIKIIPERKEVK